MFSNDYEMIFSKNCKQRTTMLIIIDESFLFNNIVIVKSFFFGIWKVYFQT